MKKISLALVGGLSMICCLNVVPMASQAQATAGATASVGQRSKDLSKLFSDIWEDRLKHSPELASFLGDKRYNDQLSDYSTQEVNAALARGRGFIQRLSEIETTGLPDQERLSAELMLRSLIDDQEGAKFKEWEMPVNQFSGFHTELPRLVNDLQFDTVKDYDDYIARLKKVPTAFSQITTNMELGIDEGRVPPQYLLEKVVAQTQALADQKPADSPFALPLKKFPKTVSAADQKRISDEMLAIVHKLGFSDLKSFSAALKANPKEHPASKEALLGAYRSYIAQMQPKLPGLFGTLPKAQLEVVAVPAFIEKDQAAAYYNQGSPDGKRPGRVNVNTYNFAERSLAPVEAVSYHEGIPGHHLQISISQELTGLPEFRKQSYYTAFTEGWALYSERLGKEIGFYQDPYNDYGRLEADIWRAIRLVVDTGVHSKHWTRQQMVDYFHDHSAIDETNIQAEVDRYIAWPGQALGYKMGQLKILELRQRAQTALGSKFDLKAFHDVVLDSGALPLDVLEQRVDEWIATQKK